MIIKQVENFLSGKIEYNEWYENYYHETIEFFQEKINSISLFKWKKFIEFYCECYLYFIGINKVDTDFIFHYKSTIKEVRKIKILKSYMSFENEDSLIKRMTYTYVKILTLYYAFFNKTPDTYSYIYDSLFLVSDTGLDKITGNIHDGFINEKILKLTKKCNNYYDKISIVKRLIKKYFNVNLNSNEITYTFKDKWPYDEDGYPLPFKCQRYDDIRTYYCFYDEKNDKEVVVVDMY